MSVLLAAIQIGGVLGFFHLFAIGSYGFTVSEALLIVIAIILAYRTLWQGKPLYIPQSREMLASVLLWCAFAASTFAVLVSTRDQFIVQSAKSFFHFTYIWIGCMLLVLLRPSAENLITAFRVNLVIALLAAVYAMYQLPARILDLPFGWIEISNASFSRGLGDEQVETQLALQFGNFIRATSFFFEPSALAAYSSSALFLVIVPFFRRSAALFTSKVCIWTIIVCLLIALLLAFSLTGVMLLLCGSAVAVLLYPKTAPVRLLIGVTASAVVVLSVNIFITYLTEMNVLSLFQNRITSIVTGKAADQIAVDDISGESYRQRTSDYRLGVMAWQHSPLLGVGIGCFSLTPEGRRYNSPFLSSVYPSVLAEAGAVGFLILILFLVFMITGTFSDNARWERFNGKEKFRTDLFAFYLPFKTVFVVFLGFTGNMMVSTSYWVDVALIMAGQNVLRDTLGTSTYKEINVLTISLKDRLRNSLLKGARVGTHT